MILPNAANQCPSCLAQSFNLKERVQRGPGGAHKIVVHQCRECRRYKRTEKHHEHAEHESPTLLAICLKHIPALSSNAEPRLHLQDAGWIWTEPHSMRLKVWLNIRTEIQNVNVQQRVVVELHNQWQQCPDCNREYTNRTWHAVVQLRQHRNDAKKGLATLEMALARNKTMRQHVLRIDTARDGFDFYFLSQVHAQSFAQFVQSMAPMRVKTSQKLVSSDVKNNTANMKTNVACDLVPLCRDDLVLIHKRCRHKLAGELVVVTKVASVLHLVSASPTRNSLVDSMTDLNADAYYKYEKEFRLILSPTRLVPFVVLDVELCTESGDGAKYQGPNSGVGKYALADVQVAREVDFGVNDDTFQCVTHLGHLISAGDTVLGYDLSSNVGDDLEEYMRSGFVLPDVVLVKKIARQEDYAVVNETERKPKLSKKKERRRKKENRRMRELEESAVRMGFFEDEEGENYDFQSELERDPELAEKLRAMEKEFEAMEVP